MVTPVILAKIDQKYPIFKLLIRKSPLNAGLTFLATHEDEKKAAQDSPHRLFLSSNWLKLM